MIRGRRCSMASALPAGAAAFVAAASVAVAPGAAQTPDSATGPVADLAHVDAHVAAVPAGAESSIPTLARYLAAAGPSDRERARAIFQWVTSNVAYDVAGYSGSAYADLSAESILRRRTAVCTGYAGLAGALGEAMGLEVEVVHGWSKGYGYQAGGPIGEAARHAWNAVRIDGEWALMDPTWGAGYIDEHGRFVRRAQDHYFLTDPAAFVFDHLPAEPRWQLLDDPVTRAEYADLVFLRPHFFVLGLEVRSHRRGTLETDDRATVEIGTPGDVLVLATLHRAEDDREVGGRRTFVEQGGGTARIDAVLPRPGAYLLRLFARPRGHSGPYRWAADYRIEAAAGDADGGFPVAYDAFREHDARLLAPLTGTLDAGAPHTFVLRVPGARAVAVVVGDEWHFLTAGADHTFTGRAAVSAGEATVVARFEEGGRYTGLVEYVAR